jgi:hypothetical protein
VTDTSQAGPLAVRPTTTRSNLFCDAGVVTPPPPSRPSPCGACGLET